MKILKICVGADIEKDPVSSDEHYLEAESFTKFKKCFYFKKDVINQISQVNSLKNLGLDVVFGFLSLRRYPWSLLKFGLRLKDIIRKQRIDLVHVSWGSTTALVAVLFSSVPVVVSFCGSDLMGSVGLNGRKTFLGNISSWLSQISALGAKRIIVKSERLKETLWPINRIKCSVIPNGVDFSVFNLMDKEEARSKLGWSSKARIIIFFPSGGAAVKDQPLAEKIITLVQVKIKDVQFKFVDNVPHEDLVYYYNAADLMLLTSYHEGSNNSLKEAMCCNLPIVSVNCGDARERLEGVYNSWVEESREPDILSEKVLEILKISCRSNGRTKIECIDLNNISHRIKSVYEEVVR